MNGDDIMPPKFKFSKDQIIDKAYEIVSSEGADNLTARHLGEKLNSSSKVIFGLFNGMDELKECVIQKGYSEMAKQLNEALANRNRLSYITCGLVYIGFARNNPNMFKLLYMRDRSNESKTFNDESLEGIYQTISKKSNVSLEEAKEAHLKYWFYMHGIATLVSSSYLSYDEAYIEQLLKEGYEGIIYSIKNRK